MRSLAEAKAFEATFAEEVAKLGVARRAREKIAREALRAGLGLWSDGFDAGAEACLKSLRDWANLPNIPPELVDALRICIQNLEHAQLATAGRDGIETIIRQIDERLS